MYRCDFIEKRSEVNFCIILVKNVRIYTVQQISHTFVSTILCDVCSAHMFPQTGMHTQAQEQHRDEGWGFLTSWPRPAGAFWSVSQANWALGVDCLCNSPDLQRNKSPLYFPHMFKLHQNKLTLEKQKKRKTKRSCVDGHFPSGYGQSG